jgi:hypothetical protein
LLVDGTTAVPSAESLAEVGVSASEAPGIGVISELRALSGARGLTGPPKVHVSATDKILAIEYAMRWLQLRQRARLQPALGFPAEDVCAER